MAPPPKRAKRADPETEFEPESESDAADSGSGEEYVPSPPRTAGRSASRTPRGRGAGARRGAASRAAVDDVDDDVPGTSSSSSAAGGGLNGVKLKMRCKTLEEENAELREQLAAVQAPTQSLKYDTARQPEFLKKLQKSQTVQLLDLSGLVRTTNSFKGDWYPQWKPDKKLDAAVSALIAGTDDVKGLDLGDAQWASEDKYAKEFQQLLRKYKPNVTNLRVTVRALVERPEIAKSVKKTNWRYAKHNTPREYSKVDVMALVGSMPKLTTLRLVFNTLGDLQNAYAGEFDPASQKKRLFAKVKNLEVYLTDEWFQEHVVDEDPSVESGPAKKRRVHPGSDDDDDDEEDEEEQVAVPSYSYHRDTWRRKATADPRLLDLLRGRRDVITHLDMLALRKPKEEHPALALIAKLTHLRSIVVRAELLHLTEAMRHLEAVELHVSGRLSEAVVDGVASHVSGSAAVRGLRRLDVRVLPVMFEARLSAVLAALAARCARLEALSLTGSGWRSEDLAALLRANPGLAELRLDYCGALEAEHLPLIAALDGLRSAYLPSRLRGKPGADQIVDKQAKGLDLRWQ